MAKLILWIINRNNINLTGFLKAFRRKKDLQLSHDTSSKLYPFAFDPQMTQVNEPSFDFFEFVVSIYNEIIFFPENKLDLFNR